MITESDSPMTVDVGSFYAIVPSSYNFSVDEYIEKVGAKKVPAGFDYSSDQNDDWLSVDQIRSLIKQHLDPSFSV
jgi:hypothetical protein